MKWQIVAAFVLGSCVGTAVALIICKHLIVLSDSLNEPKKERTSTIDNRNDGDPGIPIKSIGVSDAIVKSLKPKAVIDLKKLTELQREGKLIGCHILSLKPYLGACTQMLTTTTRLTFCWDTSGPTHDKFVILEVDMKSLRVLEFR